VAHLDQVEGALLAGRLEIASDLPLQLQKLPAHCQSRPYLGLLNELFEAVQEGAVLLC
jgi:hypothetical protein